MKKVINFILLLFLLSDFQIIKASNLGLNRENNEYTENKIQQIIDSLPKEGGKINLPSGTFIINQPIKLKDNVWLQGEGRGTILIVADSVGIILEGINGARISDITIRSAERQKATAGVVIDNSGECQINNVYIQGFKKFGIWMRNNSFLCELSSCYSTDNGQANFYFEKLSAGGRGGDFVPNIVNNCISYGGKYGFEFNQTIVLNLTGCAVFQSLDYGYYLHSTSNSINISGSRSFQVGSDAVHINDSHEINVSSNIFCWQRGHGIVLNNVKWGTIASNNFIDSGIRTRDGSYRNGAVLQNETKGIQITGNAIFNWGDQAPMEYGITEDESCENNLIANNNINYYTKRGILSLGKGTMVSSNVTRGDSAYIGMDRKPYPDFDTVRIHKLFKY